MSVDAGIDGDAVDLVPGSIHHWGGVTGRRGEAVDLSVVPAAPRQRLCYIEELAAGWCAIRNPSKGIGAGLSWDVAAFPHLWFWQEIGGSLGMPWYGRASITALEPASQFPSHGLEAAIAAGTARSLPPHGSATTRLVFTAFAAPRRRSP